MSKKIFILIFIILVGLAVYFGVWNFLKKQKIFEAPVQIEATAKQFPEVKEVRFLPEELFQP